MCAAYTPPSYMFLLDWSVASWSLLDLPLIRTRWARRDRAKMAGWLGARRRCWTEPGEGGGPSSSSSATGSCEECYSSSAAGCSSRRTDIHTRRQDERLWKGEMCGPHVARLGGWMVGPGGRDIPGTFSLGVLGAAGSSYGFVDLLPSTSASSSFYFLFKENYGALLFISTPRILSGF
jgi:hypothetical protein